MAITDITHDRLVAALCDRQSAQEIIDAVTSPAEPVLSSGTDATHLGFFGITATTRAGVITQSYSTATRTLANSTFAAITDSTGGTPSTTFGAIVAPSSNATSSLTADMAAVKNALAQIAVSLAQLNADLLNVKQVLNAVTNDLAAYGLERVATATGPTISSISPSTTSLAGNAYCTITGTGFTGTTGVTFGGVRAQWFYVVNDSTITCSPFPVSSAQTVSVVVTAGGTASTSFGFVAFAPVNTLTTYTPSSPADEGYSNICRGPDLNLWTTGYSGTLIKTTTAGVSTVFTSAIDGLLNIITGSDGKLWAQDFDGNIWQFTTADVSTSFALPGVDGNAVFAKGMCVGPDGNIWITTVRILSGSAFLFKVTPAGVITTYTFASFGIADGHEMVGICCGLDGNLWITDFFAHSLIVVNPADGTTATHVLSGATNINFICVGPDGKFWIGKSNANTIYQVDPGAPTVATAFTLAATYTSIQGLVAGPDNTTWVLLGKTGVLAVQSVSTSGTPAMVVVLTAEPNGDICVGSDGNIWVCNGLDTIIKLS